MSLHSVVPILLLKSVVVNWCQRLACCGTIVTPVIIQSDSSGVQRLVLHFLIFFRICCVCLMFYVAFNLLSVIPRRFLGELPFLLNLLYWHQRVSRYANHSILIDNEGMSLLPLLKSLAYMWYRPGSPGLYLKSYLCPGGTHVGPGK